MVLTDRRVSRFHFEIVADERQTIIRDLGSKNGTTVGTLQILAAHVRDGATISLGESRLQFSCGTEQAQIELASRERFGQLVGRSAAMRAVFAVLEKAAPTDATIILEGETGTGKEVAAESIHLESARRQGAFAVLDCGSIPPSLIESELFGHERGAFTGAQTMRRGVLEQAEGGTVFLDEIGELPIEVQPKLLRFLERRQVRRVGSNTYLPVDVRVVAATNRNLLTEVNAGRFRADLYYRLAVVRVTLPALRERPDDLPLLVDALIEAMRLDEAETAFLREATFLDDLAHHAWPGNIRELRNHLERCVALAAPAPLGEQAPDTNMPVDATRPLQEVRTRWVDAIERRYLVEVLRRCDDNVAAAARVAGLSRVQVYRLLWKHGLR